MIIIDDPKLTDEDPNEGPFRVFEKKLANGSCHQAKGPLSFRLVDVAATL